MFNAPSRQKSVSKTTLEVKIGALFLVEKLFKEKKKKTYYIIVIPINSLLYVQNLKMVNLQYYYNLRVNCIK